MESRGTPENRLSLANLTVEDSHAPAKSGWFGIGQRMREGLLRINQFVSRTVVGQWFRLEGSGRDEEIVGARLTTELRSGLTTFATMAYIISVNASVISDSGGPCKCEGPIDLNGGCDHDAAYRQCLGELKLDLITATATIAGVSSILFGLVTNLPVALAPGMGLNAYFTYQIVGQHGQGGLLSYNQALTAVFLEGWIFMLLALTGLRQWLVRIMPSTIKTASGVGIGMFLTLCGLTYTSGIGLITGGSTTPLVIAGCDPAYRSTNGMCEDHEMTHARLWIGIICGGLFTAVMMSYRFKAAMVLGIALVSMISWPRNTPFTYFPHTTEGDQRFDFFRQIVSLHPIKHTLRQLTFFAPAGTESGGLTADFALALFTMLYVDIIDCTATLYSMARFSNRARAGEDSFPRSTVAYCTDSFCISMGALLGCSPVTAFVESGAGIAEGGRTGITAITTGICFLFSILFAPIFASVPPWATGCTLVIVGCLMARQVTKVNWRYIGDALPSFITIALIPFTYSVAYGLIAGLFTYTGINLFIWLLSLVTGGRAEPVDYELKEYWSLKPRGELPFLWRIIIRCCGRDKEGKHEKMSDGGSGTPDVGDATASTIGMEMRDMRSGAAAAGEEGGRSSVVTVCTNRPEERTNYHPSLSGNSAGVFVRDVGREENFAPRYVPGYAH